MHDTLSTAPLESESEEVLPRHFEIIGRQSEMLLGDVDVPGTGHLVLSNGRLILAGTGRLTALASR